MTRLFSNFAQIHGPQKIGHSLGPTKNILGSSTNVKCIIIKAVQKHALTTPKPITKYGCRTANCGRGAKTNEVQFVLLFLENHKICTTPVNI